MPTILIVNDDGIDSPMLPAMVEHLRPLGTVQIAVPSEEQSWRAKAVTRFGRITVERREEFGVEAHAISGTPTDCVNLAIHHLMKRRPDWIVSGINIGVNAGLSFVMHSGTVGGAMEGLLQGIPATAFSTYFPPHLFKNWSEQGALSDPESQRIISSTSERMAAMLARQLAKGTPDVNSVLNVNFPGVVDADTPVRWAPLQDNRYSGLFRPDGDGYVHCGQIELHDEDRNECDRIVLERGEISVTALSPLGISIPPPDNAPF